jgi:hypothetical protein
MTGAAAKTDASNLSLQMHGKIGVHAAMQAAQPNPIEGWSIDQQRAAGPILILRSRSCLLNEKGTVMIPPDSVRVGQGYEEKKFLQNGDLSGLLGFVARKNSGKPPLRQAEWIERQAVVICTGIRHRKPRM